MQVPFAPRKLSNDIRHILRSRIQTALGVNGYSKGTAVLLMNSRVSLSEPRPWIQYDIPHGGI